MSRQIAQYEPNPNLRSIYFDLRLIDGVTSALDQAGGQPQISINNGVWQSIGISTLTSMGFGKYFAILDQSILILGTVIISRYINTNVMETVIDESIVVIAPTTQYYTSNLLSTNSYVQIEDARSYFDARLHSDFWDNATPKNQVKALITATRSIDRLRFKGVKFDPKQPLEFPRKLFTETFDRNVFPFIPHPNVYPNYPYPYNQYPPPDPSIEPFPSYNLPPYTPLPSNFSSSVPYIPNEIKFACCEIAIVLLSGFDMESEINSLNISNQRYGSVDVTSDTSIVNQAIRSGIPSQQAWMYLRPFLEDPYLITLTRA